MVGSVHVYLDGALGSDDVIAKEASEKGSAAGLYDPLCAPWIWLWTAVCTGAGDHVWIKFQGNGYLDHHRIAI